MGIARTLSKRWLVLVTGLVILFLVAAGIVALLSGQAADEQPTPVVAEIQLNPPAGQPGTTVTVAGRGWQPGETVLVYLVEVESNATDGAIYASTLANRDGQIAAEFDYPQTSPWSAEMTAIIEARGLSSRREAQAVFEVIPNAGEPTSEPTAEPTSKPPTDEPTGEPTEEPTDGSPTTEPTTEPPATPTPTPWPTSEPTPTPTPTPAPPTITDWRGEYYDNLHLAGSPRLVRNDESIDFHWGTGSPAAGLPADKFSVRWTRALNFAEGAYRFTVEVDDGARLWVDGLLVIDQWHDGIGRYTGDLYLTGGHHDLRLETYEHLGRAKANLGWIVVRDYPDWKGEYYGNPNLMGSPRLVRNDPGIDFDWGSGSPAVDMPRDNFSVRWTRALYFAEGAYRFTVEVDDGARLWVDGLLVIDQWHDGIGHYTGDIYLTGGYHDLRLETYEHLGGAKANLGWTVVRDYPDWKGEYYNNPDLQGSPRLVRNDPEVDFDWGSGSPSGLVSADNFGVRWTQTLEFEEGLYRFCAQSDDGIRVQMDDRAPFIDEWQDGPGTHCADLYVTAGQHEARVEYYEHLGSAMVQFGWDRVADGQVPPDAIRPIETDLWASEPAFVALDSADAFRGFLQRYGLRRGKDGEGTVAEVLWDREIVLAALLGEKATGGYAVELLSITYEGTAVTVHLRVDEPTPGQIVDQATSSPYTVVAVQRQVLPEASLTFTFVDQDGQQLEQAVTSGPLTPAGDRRP
jgi:hypothetical protein